MPTTEIRRTEVYQNIDGVTTLVDIIETEVEVPTEAEIIAEKEAELLKMYAELQALKEQTNS